MINNNNFVQTFDSVNQKIKEIYNFLIEFKIEIKTIQNTHRDLYNLKEEFLLKYPTFFGIKRFAIPIIGVINSGKSTFLNYLLKLHGCLETKSEIATKFICLIRHNKNVIKPELYDVIFEERSFHKFNFIKGEKLKGDDVKKQIEERNQIIGKKIGKIPISDFFLILETNIPFFNNEFENYSEFFEFMDCPELNEIGINNDNQNNGNSSIGSNYYFQKIFPIIQPNIKFGFFIFDIEFENINTIEIMNEFQKVKEIDENNNNNNNNSNENEKE